MEEAMPPAAYVVVEIVFIVSLVLFALAVLSVCCCNVANRPYQPAESAELRAARARAVLAAWAAGPLTGQVAAPPVLRPLPCFPYAGQPPQSDKPGETTVCAICLDPLRPGQLCSEVPPCGHVFHGACLGEWARSNSSCPLCRAKIVPGSDEVAIAVDMV